MIAIPAALKAMPWKLIAQVAGAVILIALIWVTLDRAWRDLPEARRALETSQEALTLEEACGEGSKCQERQVALLARQAVITEQMINGHEKEMADLRSRPIPPRVIRVCREAGTGGVRVPSDPSEPTGASAGGMVSGTDEFDTRPLRELALRADEINSGYRWLRVRDDALSQPPKEE